MSTITFIIEKSDLDLSVKFLIKKPKLITNRSDISHQILLAILDSPLIKEKDIEIYINTEKHLIKIEKEIRIPRSLNRFNGLIKQLNEKLKIKDENGNVLIQLLKKPVEKYFKPNSYKIGLSDTGININSFDKNIFNKESIIFFINGISKGSDENISVYDKTIKVSNYSLSASVAINRICSWLENFYNIF